MRSRPVAATLLELTIVSGLLTLIVIMVTVVLIRGMHFYRDSNEALEIRQEALFGITRLTKELRETNPGVVRIDGPNRGVVFPSPRDATGQAQPTTDGKLTWIRWIAYYVAPFQGGQAIFRKEEPIADDASGKKPRRPPDPDGAWPPPPAGPSIVHNIPYFTGTSTAAQKMVARRVTDMKLAIYGDTVEVYMQCSVSSRYTHTVELHTKVIPKI